MQEDNLYVRVDDLWFQDGNLVIRADNKIFKVTKSIVAARSSVFRDMVAFPQPDTPNDLGGEKIDGCTVVVLHDLARDVEAFLRAIFDSSYFMPPPDTADIHDILGILRLSHKYDVQYLHRRALRHLEGQLYFQSIQAFRNCKEDLDIVDSGVLAAVHEVSALWLLPIAYYKACFFAPATSTQLQTEHHSQQCLKARLDLAREHVVSIAFLKRSGANATCMLPRECNTARTLFRIRRCWSDVHPLQVWDRPEWMHMAAHGMCSPCLQKAQTMHSDALDKLWDRLPVIFDLPPWAELHAMRKAAMDGNV
ncbi:hypothetical protein C8R47DRAFT_1039465 [Mycena vitilis]|nr:hypothetical protein C8R47DRAFT_1039465 [Mycena vitilis]